MGCSLPGTRVGELLGTVLLTILQVGKYRSFSCFPLDGAILQVFVFSYLLYWHLGPRGSVVCHGKCPVFPKEFGVPSVSGFPQSRYHPVMGYWAPGL